MAGAKKQRAAPAQKKKAAPRKKAVVTKLESFDTKYVPIDSITPYPNNPRNNDLAVEKVARSIEQFGWRQPIVVDPENVIIAGHTRLYAAQSLGLKRVPVHVAHGLTKAQVKAYRIADNRVGQEATWDEARLLEELNALTGKIDLDSLGFDPAELMQILEGPEEFDPNQAWSGLPEFNQGNDKPFRSILIHFKNQEVLDKFIKATGMKITPDTRYTWYPKVEIDKVSDKAYKSES